ncbi:hypothetical protein P8452_55365 [Trifolium repens]|nr:hypothetical protein P8452_55365 [Trifolium repens]
MVACVFDFSSSIKCGRNKLYFQTLKRNERMEIKALERASCCFCMLAVPNFLNDACCADFVMLLAVPVFAVAACCASFCCCCLLCQFLLLLLARQFFLLLLDVPVFAGLLAILICLLCQILQCCLLCQIL